MIIVIIDSFSLSSQQIFLLGDPAINPYRGNDLQSRSTCIPESLFSDPNLVSIWNLPSSGWQETDPSSLELIWVTLCSGLPHIAPAYAGYSRVILSTFKCIPMSICGHPGKSPPQSPDHFKVATGSQALVWEEGTGV